MKDVRVERVETEVPDRVARTGLYEELVAGAQRRLSHISIFLGDCYTPSDENDLLALPIQKLVVGRSP